MTDLVIALLGSGVLVQLFNAIATLRQNKRQMNANALGTEVDALEKTIKIIYAKLEEQDAYHKRVVDELHAEIDSLKKRIKYLEGLKGDYSRDLAKAEEIRAVMAPVHKMGTRAASKSLHTTATG